MSKNNQNYRTFTYPTNNFYPNSIKYYNDNGTIRRQWGLTWQGKGLTRLDYLGVGIIDYDYDESGIMTSRLKLGEHSFFTLEGSNVISLKKVSTSGSYDPIILDFTYDSNNMLAGITYNKEYFYVRDILGVIRGIINSSGSYIIKYDYTAYGEVTKNIIASSGDDLIVANHNPFMYKGYYYDEDLKCYYLNSRFYIPSVCRFISPDDHSYLDYEDLREINLYCYCYDNPVMYCDPEGRGAILAAIITGAIIGLSSTYLAIVNKNIQNDGFQWSDLNPNFKEKWIDYLVNTASGAFIGLFGSIGLPVFLSAPLCGLTNTIANALTGDIKTFEEGIQCFLVSTLISSLTLGISRMSRLERLPAIRKGNYIELLFRSFGKIIDPYIAFWLAF